MKLTKSEFKAMIKECMRELIKEGAFGQTITESKNTTSKQKMVQPTSTRLTGPASRDPMVAERARMAARRMAGAEDDLDAMMPPGLSDTASPSAQIQNPGLQNLVESTARMMAKGDSQLAESYASIFADTAVNTLPQMMANDTDRRGYGNLAAAGMQGQVEKVNEQELQSLAVAGDMSRWAAVAFGNTGRK